MRTALHAGSGATPDTPVREHYDRLSELYLRFWGEHIHHGVFVNGDSRARAQVRLIELLAGAARIPSGARVLDVGCGLGGSCRWLAANLGCSVLGVTISPVQARLARRLTPRSLRGLVEYAVADARALSLPPASFDVAWIIECIEHLADKARFLSSCAHVLRPGGALALCTWLRPDTPSQGQRHRLDRICKAMVCPSLGSMREHVQWFREAGLGMEIADDLSAAVAPTWDRCLSIVRRPSARVLIRFQPRAVHDFVSAFSLMRDCFQDGTIRYVLFVGRTQDAPGSRRLNPESGARTCPSPPP